MARVAETKALRTRYPANPARIVSSLRSFRWISETPNVEFAKIQLRSMKIVAAAKIPNSAGDSARLVTTSTAKFEATSKSLPPRPHKRPSVVIVRRL